MLDGMFGFYLLQLKVKKDQWLDIHEFTSQAEAAEALKAAGEMDRASTFRLVRIWR